MRKKLKIIIPLIVILLLGCCAGLLFSGSRSFSTGVFLRGADGQALWITPSGAPVQLTFPAAIAERSAEKMKTGDRILLLHDGILETYPGSTGCYFLMKTGAGKESDIPADTYDSLRSMGWLAEDRGPAETPPEESTTRPVPVDPLAEEEIGAELSFALRSFREVYAGKTDQNTLFSPFSLRLALALTANGAAGDTRSQMETLLGLPADALNSELKQSADAFAAGGAVKLANTLYVKDGVLTLNDGFISTAKAYYDAEIRESLLDAAAVQDVNDWVKTHTDGKIEKIVEAFDENAAMVLLSALSFTADWQQKYAAGNVREGSFTNAAGREQKTDMMYSLEHSFLENDTVTGFLKHYAGGQFAFAALLPKPGETVSSVLENLTPASLAALLQNVQPVPTETGIPRFSFSDQFSLRQPLETLGMTAAFDPAAADFSPMGRLAPGAGNLSVDLILQKTFIEVTPAGTSAAAVTEEVMTTAAMIVDPQTVILDRPFLFMIFDTVNQIPLFLGVVNSVG